MGNSPPSSRKPASVMRSPILREVAPVAPKCSIYPRCAARKRSGMNRSIGAPIAFSPGHWKIFSAASLNSTTFWSSSIVMIASIAEWMMPPSRASLARSDAAAWARSSVPSPTRISSLSITARNARSAARLPEKSRATKISAAAVERMPSRPPAAMNSLAISAAWAASNSRWPRYAFSSSSTSSTSRRMRSWISIPLPDPTKFRAASTRPSRRSSIARRENASRSARSAVRLSILLCCAGLSAVNSPNSRRSEWASAIPRS